MTGPLNHFMPVIAANRHRQIPEGLDPYFNYVSFLTEFHGRPDTNFSDIDPMLNIPRDSSESEIPLFISGNPIRFPHTGDGIEVAPRGVSETASYFAKYDDGVGAAIIVGENSAINLSNQDFEIRVKLRTTNTNAYNIAGRWRAGGGLSWAIGYYKAMKTLNFVMSWNGTNVFSQNATFRLGTINDGMTVAEFANDQPHEIIVSRVGDIIKIYIDGMAGSEYIKMADVESKSIFDPAPHIALLNIGSVGADLTGYRTSTGNFRGYMDSFKMSVAGVEVLDVDFNEYWSYWWIGNYPQNKYPNSVSWGGSFFQDQQGLKKHPTYIGTYWPYDEEIDFQTEDFTIEVFGVSISFLNQEVQHLIGMGWDSYKCWRFLTKNSAGNGSPGRFVFQFSEDNITVKEIIIYDGLPSGHIITGDFAAVRFGSTISIYHDGVRVAQGAITTGIYSGSFGQVPLSFYNAQQKGNTADDPTRILAVRLTKGIARYRNRGYRVPTLPLPKEST